MCVNCSCLTLCDLMDCVAMGFSWQEKSKVKLLSRVRLFGTQWVVAYQATLSMGFSRQGHWNSLPFLVPGNLLTQGSNWGLLCCRQIPYQLSYQGSLFSSRHMSIVLRPEMTPFVLMLSPNACVGKGAWCNSLSLEVFLLFMISSLLSSVQSLSGV